MRDMGLEQASSAVGRVKAVDGAGNLGPAATATVRLLGKPGGSLPGSGPEIAHVPAATPLPRLGAGEVAVIDELDKVHPQSGEFIPPQPAGYLHANHLWNAAERRITLHAARNEFVAFQVLIQGQQLGRDVDLRPELVFSGQAATAIQVDVRALPPGADAGGPLARSHRAAGSADPTVAAQPRAEPEPSCRALRAA